MTTFLLTDHSIGDRKVLEIYEDGQLIGIVCPADRGIRIISKYFTPDTVPMDTTKEGDPTSIGITIWDGQPRGPWIKGAKPL